MNVRFARRVITELESKNSLTDDEFESLKEAYLFIYVSENETEALTQLGGIYYEREEYQQARYYYEMAAEEDDIYAKEGLAYIYYYGRCGEPDYEKAYKYYSEVAETGNTEARYKIADMYKNGYYVEKDYDQYCKIIEELYEELENEHGLFDKLPEVMMRLGHIRKEEGNKTEALDLFVRARNYFEQRLEHSDFFGIYTNIDWAVNSIYEVSEFDEFKFDFFDLYYVLKNECSVSFYYQYKEYNATSYMNEEDNTMHVRFCDIDYGNVNEFIRKAEINNKKISLMKNEVYLFGVEDLFS